jgi:hypothetical protein
MIVYMIEGSGIADVKANLQEPGTDMDHLLQHPPSGVGLHLVGWIIVT